MLSNSWEKHEELVSRIIKQVAKEATDGAEYSWNDWLVFEEG
jgi:hypothetical protein